MKGCVDSHPCMNEANKLPFIAMAGAVRMGSLEEEVKSGLPGRVGKAHWGANLARLSCLSLLKLPGSSSV